MYTVIIVSQIFYKQQKLSRLFVVAVKNAIKCPCNNFCALYITRRLSIMSTKRLCESTRHVFEKLTQETVYELRFKTKKLIMIIQLIAVFFHHQTQNFLKNPA